MCWRVCVSSKGLSDKREHSFTYFYYILNTLPRVWNPQQFVLPCCLSISFNWPYTLSLPVFTLKNLISQDETPTASNVSQKCKISCYLQVLHVYYLYWRMTNWGVYSWIQLVSLCYLPFEARLARKGDSIQYQDYSSALVVRWRCD